MVGEWPDTHGAVEMLLVSPAPADAESSKPAFAAALDAVSWNVIVGSGRTCRPGQTAAFGPAGEGFFRLSYAASEADNDGGCQPKSFHIQILQNLSF